MKHKLFTPLKVVLFGYLILTVLFPLCRLFIGITPGSLRVIFSSEQLLPMIWNSLVTTIPATVISVLLSFLLAFAMKRSSIPGKGIFLVILTLPMLIPSISHGMGLVLLLGDNGILTSLLGKNMGLYGYKGIIIGSVLYSFPAAFLLFHDAFRYEDGQIYEAAAVLNIPKSRQFLKLTLPSLKGSITSAFLMVFTMIFTDYGVPLMTGGTVMTLPVYMYREVIGMMNYSSGAVIGGILLFPAVVAFLFDLRKGEEKVGSLIAKPLIVEPRPMRDRLILISFLLFSVLICLPFFAFLCLSFLRQYPVDLHFTTQHMRKVFSSGVGLNLINSIAIALLTALCGTCLSYFSAYVTARSKSNLPNRCLHFISLLSMAIPGVVLGLCYVLSFHGLPLYSTIFILVIVNIAHFFSSPYLLAYHSLKKFHENLEDVALTLGLSKMHLLFSVYIPSTVSTIIEMYSFYFVNAMITISAVSFLINFRTTTLSLMIPQLESQSFPEGTAIISLLILLLNLLEKAIASLIRRYSETHKCKDPSVT